MANINGSAEVATTPSKEQDATEVEATEEEGANGQLPDSMYNSPMACKVCVLTVQTSSRSRSSCPTSPSRCP
jgi:hypothetical protein